MNEPARKRIIVYGFILTVFVIWLHAGESLITDIPGQIAVPGFFLLSGFLFFFGFPADGSKVAGDRLTKTLFLEKLFRRIRTLVIPYLLWNFIYFLIYLAFGEAAPDEFFEAVFFYRCNPVFWYLYQLILITLFTPVIYWFLKVKRRGLLFLAAVFLLAVRYNLVHRLTGYDLINFDALFYYAVGAFASLQVVRQGKTMEKKQCVKALVSCLLVFVLCSMLKSRLNADWINAAIIGQRLSGSLALWFLISLLPALTVKPWMTISFFTYATHYPVIRVVWKLESLAGVNGYAAVNIITYILMPVFCVAAAWGLYRLMANYTPKLLGLLTGGRGTRQ